MDFDRHNASAFIAWQYHGKWRGFGNQGMKRETSAMCISKLSPWLRVRNGWQWANGKSPHPPTVEFRLLNILFHKAAFPFPFSLFCSYGNHRTVPIAQFGRKANGTSGFPLRCCPQQDFVLSSRTESFRFSKKYFLDVVRTPKVVKFCRILESAFGFAKKERHIAQLLIAERVGIWHVVSVTHIYITHTHMWFIGSKRVYFWHERESARKQTHRTSLLLLCCSLITHKFAVYTFRHWLDNNNGTDRAENTRAQLRVQFGSFDRPFWTWLTTITHKI